MLSQGERLAAKARTGVHKKEDRQAVARNESREKFLGNLQVDLRLTLPNIVMEGNPISDLLGSRMAFTNPTCPSRSDDYKEWNGAY